MNRPSQRNGLTRRAYLGRLATQWVLSCIFLAIPGAVQAHALAAPDSQAPQWQISERGGGERGGELEISLTSEPKTFLPLAAYDTATRAVVERLHAGLVRMDGETFEIQPALASSWTLSPERDRLVLKLRQGVRFSDGQPFDADDVLFSLQAVQDPELGAAQASSLVIDGKPVTARKLGPYEVEIGLPFPHPTPLLLLTGIAMLPEHRLGESYRSGTLANAWGLGTDPLDMAGLGPFRLAQHVPGSHLVLERNPFYWRRDAKAPAGVALPYLDRIVVRFVADENAKLLRFRAGGTDLLERIPGDAFADLDSRSRAGAGFRVRDLGAGLGTVFLVFNLNQISGDGLDAAARVEIERRQRWFRNGALRRAVSLAMDRPSIARIVYHGRATPVVSDISPANRDYYDPTLETAGLALDGPDLDRARRELRSAGFEAGADGRWRDADGEPVAFTLVTNTSNSKRSAIATLVQEDLRRLGLDVTFVGVEFGSLVDRLTRSFDYDLLLLEFSGGVPDPSSSLNVWRLDGDSHYFHLDAKQATFKWEARIDELMRRQAHSTDPKLRKALIDQMQQLVAKEVPFVYLVAPNVLVGAARGLGNFAPSILEHPTLWNADELYWRTASNPPEGNRSQSSRVGAGSER